MVLPCYYIPARGPAIEKKALLVGIGYNSTKGSGKWDPIPTSIPNVKKLAAFLREHCGYTDIVIMTDEDDVDKRYQPTKINLRREMKALCRGVQPGDRRVFYFAGHSDQMPCLTGSEEDGMDEVLVAANGLKIRDNTLHNWLVKPLPAGASLTAIFDSCTSGTLLDLDHYKCNNVYRPWVNKGGRKSNTLRNYVVRKNCKGTRTGPPTRRCSTFWKSSGDADVQFPSLTLLMQSLDNGSTANPVQLARESGRHNGERCASPERQFVCEGWCRNMIPKKDILDHPDVVSISSSNDGQTSWDASTRNGDSISMTAFMIKILKERPQITYSQLMTSLNHEVHIFTRKMHNNVRRGRARRKADGKNTDSEDTDPEEEFKGEMDNFQDLQLGSITPVDMDRIFVL